MRIFYPKFENVRIMSGLLSIVILSALTGSALGLQYAIRHPRPPKVNSSLFLAISAPQQHAQTEQSAVNALNQERIDELKTAVQAAEDDRTLLHDQIYKLATTENTHYNAMHEQLAVDEARLNSYTALVGGGVTLLNGIAIFLQLVERRKRKQQEEEDDRYHDPHARRATS
jgi:hypothetical protein